MKQNVDGSQYIGDWHHGEATGKGTKTLQNKSIFEGEWKNNQFMFGKCTFPNGEIYEGEWVNGVPQGKGKKSFPNGHIYDGEFFQGKPNGKGTKFEEGITRVGYWTGGKFFDGEPPEGVLEGQLEALVEA